MVLYFSGTGNSQFVALQLAERLGEETAVAVNPYIKAGGRAAFQSSRPLVLVAPTYCWRLPRVVERWVLETGFEGNRDAYFVLTCGGDCGNAAAYAKKLCAKKGLRFRGLAPVVMPENYLAMFPTPNEGECQAILEKAGPRVAALAEKIRAGEPFDQPPVSLLAKLKSGPVNPLFYAFCVRDKGFGVSGRCVSCGKCALRCPLNNIVMVDGKPAWQGNCTHCMACIGGCPTGAIAYKANSEGRRRYYIMQDALVWERSGDSIEKNAQHSN